VTASTGIITTVSGTGQVVNFDDPSYGDGGPADKANLKWPEFLTIDSVGNLYIGDSGNSSIRKVNAQTGIISTIVGNRKVGFDGDGGQAINAEMNEPRGLAITSAGNLYIADVRNYRVRAVATGVGDPNTPYVNVSSSDPKPTMNETVTLTAHVANGTGSSISGGQITWYDGTKH